MPSEINVAPVTGMTPAAVASELRILIRDHLWHGIRQLMGGGTPESSNTLARIKTLTAAQHERLTAVETSLVELRRLLKETSEVAKTRRPNDVRIRLGLARIQMDQIASQLMFVGSARSDIYHWADQLGAESLPPDVGGLAKHAERAYALVQALPTIEDPATGRAENTLRAMTSILKVYHGVDVEGAPEKLPNVLSDLMAELAEAKQTAPELWLPVTSNDHVTVPQGPFTIWGSSSGILNLLQNDIIRSAITDRGYGHPDIRFTGNLMPKVGVIWNGGSCSFEFALDVFRAVRMHFSTMRMELRDADGQAVIETPNRSEPPVWHISNPPELSKYPIGMQPAATTTVGPAIQFIDEAVDISETF